MMAGRTMREIWEATREQLALMVTADVYDLCIRPLQAMSWSNGTLTLLAPTEPARAWCEIRLSRMIEREVSLEAGRSVNVSYVAGEVERAD